METNVMGIVRAVDDLGRIVIPKEMRKTIGVREGESLEILATSNGGLFLRKPIEVKQTTSIEVTTETTITVESKKKDDNLVFNFEDWSGNTHTIKITEKQYKFLKELSDMSSDGYIDIDTWSEGYPAEDDLTDMC
jgi:AbrB family transcriptional regulator (stage V sporulation protein T)